MADKEPGEQQDANPRMPSYSGAFAATERAYLDTCFGACRIGLVERSRRDSGLVLIHWQAGGGMSAGGQPLSTAPTEAYYVLDCSGEGEPTLERIDDSRQLETRYPEHFPPVQFRRPWTRRLWERLQSPSRRLILLAALAWLVIVLLVLRAGL
ncbi:MAG: hypothetical protein CL878_13860 [Dehalococcoidia bacterium]|nr:hypothetical protein [Dehalococcoidia bacterium]